MSDQPPRKKMKGSTGTDSPEQAITVTEWSTYEDLGAFYLQDKCSDITLKVEEKPIPAHKIILIARSKYFEQRLLDDPTMTTLTLENARYEIFCRILEYIYTGDITIELSNAEMICDVIRLAHEYSLTDLKKTLSGKLDSFLDMTNVFQFLNKANDYDIDEMKETCHIFMERKLSEIFDYESLSVLTQKSMINFLKRTSDLVSLSPHHVLKIVRHFKLFKQTQIWNAAIEFEEKKLMDKNIATDEFQVKAITGNRTSLLFTNNNDLENCAYHPVDDKNGITVDLGKLRYFNYIKLRLKNIDHLHTKSRERFVCYVNLTSYRYKIQVSRDQENWKTILDYMKYDCRSYQNLYFQQQIARYIRIVGIHSSESPKNFEIVSLEIYYKSVIPKIINGIVRPTENVATEDMGAIVAEGYRPYLLNGNTKSPTTFHEIGSGASPEHIIVQLAQPYLISNMRLLLTDGSYKYSIETSADGNEWELAADRTDQMYENCQDLQFNERPVVYVKITGTVGTNGAFDCAHFESPRTNVT